MAELRSHLEGLLQAAGLPVSRLSTPFHAQPTVQVEVMGSPDETACEDAIMEEIDGVVCSTGWSQSNLLEDFQFPEERGSQQTAVDEFKGLQSSPPLPASTDIALSIQRASQEKIENPDSASDVSQAIAVVTVPKVDINKWLYPAAAQLQNLIQSHCSHFFSDIRPKEEMDKVQFLQFLHSTEPFKSALQEIHAMNLKAVQQIEEKLGGKTVAYRQVIDVCVKFEVLLLLAHCLQCIEKNESGTHPVLVNWDVENVNMFMRNCTNQEFYRSNERESNKPYIRRIIHNMIFGHGKRSSTYPPLLRDDCVTYKWVRRDKKDAAGGSRASRLEWHMAVTK